MPDSLRPAQWDKPKPPPPVPPPDPCGEDYEWRFARMYGEMMDSLSRPQQELVRKLQNDAGYHGFFAGVVVTVVFFGLAALLGGWLHSLLCVHGK